MQSIVQARGRVTTLPAFTGERIHMHGFTQRDGLPSELSRWQSTVDEMLIGIQTDGPIYLMIDQKAVQPGEMHRRGGVHIDGYWNPVLRAHGGHSYDKPSTGHSHPQEVPSPGPGVHEISRVRQHTFGGDVSEAIILLSNYSACRGWNGEWDGQPGEGGSCEHVDVSRLQPITMEAGVVYAGNYGFLHESLPLQHAVNRTVVRLNVPGWSPTLQ